jgi:hypothetical protein
MHEEMQQVERRRGNLVIHGLQEAAEGQDDGDLVGDLLEQVVPGGTPDFQVYRTGKGAQDRPRTTVVKLKSAELRDKYLNSAKNIKGKDEYESHWPPT